VGFSEPEEALVAVVDVSDPADPGEGLQHDREAIEAPVEDRAMLLGAQRLHRYRLLDVDGIGIGVEPAPGMGDGLRRGDAQQAGNRDRIAHQPAVRVQHGHDVGDSSEPGEQTQQADLPALLGPVHAGACLDHLVEDVGTADPGVGVGLVDPTRVDGDVRGRARRELIVVVGHQRRPALDTRGGGTAVGVSGVAGEQGPGIRPLRMDLGDVLARELVAAAVVGQVPLDVEAELGQPCVAAGRQRRCRRCRLVLLQVLIRPSCALTQQREEVDVLVGERVVVGGMKRGHGGGPLDGVAGRWRTRYETPLQPCCDFSSNSRHLCQFTSTFESHSGSKWRTYIE
jgi:hypothetical protein